MVGATAGLQTAQIAGVHVFCIAVALWLVLGVLPQQRRKLRPEWPAALVVCAALLASTALTGNLTNSRLVALQLLLLAGTAACLVAFGDQADIRHILLGLLITTTIASVAALLQYVGVLPYAVFLGTDRPIGLYSEPDWLGMFSAVGLVIAFRTTTGRLRTALVFLHLTALLLAAARAAWLALLVVVVLGYVAAKLSRKAPRVQQVRGGGRLVAAGLLFVTVVLGISPTLRDSLHSRIEGAFSARQEVAVQARLQQTEGLLELAGQAPWHGLGLSASGRVGVSGRIEYIGQVDNNVASNWILGWWVDGGLLAIPLILLFAWAALTRLTTTSGLVLLAVLVNSVFSNAMLIPIAWVGLALCLLENVRPETLQQRRVVNTNTARRPSAGKPVLRAQTLSASQPAFPPPPLYMLT
jgi:O-Antigen ligase